ncbi:MAG: SLC13 family permease [Bacillota bacterium]|uniref:DASS family sodium-coupled anion symporter n=1 Tax=Thermanaerosceptrum fracticalcis TaxID=1712410 RepID=A0A7G6E1M6_THEFR|nr:SLC13 family permease [Thermanaerosceptrum fracticalcis]QNB45980.1 DASS family sodium-coupled anion symporter [Thermanaerosceptrum fracticalcis]
MTAATITLLILAAAAVLFVTEVIPLAVTAMSVAVVLTLTGVLDAKAAFSGLMDSNVILFAGMFVVGQALFETGVATKLGNSVVKIAGKSEKALLAAVMIVAAGLSSVLSNTGTTAVLMPVTISIAAAAGFSRGKLLMPLALAAGLGGMITLVGTPPNLVVKGAIEKAGLGTFGFFEFGLIGIPLTIAGIIYMLTIGYKLIPDRGVDQEEVAAAVKAEAGNKTANSTKQMISILVMIGTVLAMIFEKQLGVGLHVSATIGALVLVITGVMTDKQAYRAIDWTTIFLFAGMLPLAQALDKTGAGKMIADVVIGLIGKNASPYVITAGLFLLACSLTQFMSNTASTALLAPIGIAIAKGLGADPRAVLMAIAIAASCAFATPVGTPPNTLVLGPGNYKFMDYVKVGTPLIVVMFVVSVALIPMIWPFFK